MFLSLIVTHLNHLLYILLTEIQRSMAGHIRVDEYIAKRLVRFEITRSENLCKLIYLYHQRAQFLRVLLLFYGQVHADDNVGAHLLGYVRRKIILNASINQHLGVVIDRSEYSWNGHARANGQGQDTTAMDIGRTIHDVRRHAGKWYRQIIEVDRVGIAHAEVIEKIQDVITANQSTRHNTGYQVLRHALILFQMVQFVVQEILGSERQGHRITVIVGLGPVRQFVSLDSISHIIWPIHRRDYLYHLLVTVAKRVHTPHDGTHTGTYHHINRNAHLAKVTNHTYVGNAFRATPGKYQCHFRTPDGLGSRSHRGRIGIGYYKKGQNSPKNIR